MLLLIAQAKTSERGYDLALFLERFWPILAVTALGLLAVWLLLPRVRRYPGVFGLMAGGLALVLAGLWLIRPEPIWVENLLFYIFAGMAVFFGGMMISQTQPVHAALSFAMVVLSTCGLFLLQAAPFLMAATIIIYAGAIVVTFLFVIMLAQQSGLDSADYRSREPLLASIAGFVLLAPLLCVLHRDYGMERGNEEVINQIAAHLQKIEEAEKAPSTEKLKEALKDGDVLSDFQDLVKPFEGKPQEGDKNYKNKLVSRLIDLHGKILDLDGDDVPQVTATVRKQLKEVHALGWRLQNELRGILQPDPSFPLSSFSGLPPNQAPPRGKVGLPADNVAAISQTLFTDYLIAVELAATLLLVATIGAIVIAGRKTEGLK